MRFLLAIIIAVVGFVYFKGDFQKSGKSGFKSDSNKELSSLAESKDQLDKVIGEIYTRQSEHSDFIRGSRKISTQALIAGNKKFMADYYKLLGKAYKTSSGGDKKAIRAIKDHMINWYKVSLSYLKKVDTSIESLKFSRAGNISEQISNNNHVLTEVSNYGSSRIAVN